MTMTEAANAKGMMLASDVAKVLGINRMTWQYWMTTGYVAKPSVRIGKRLFYTAPQVAEMMKRFEEE